ncbi:43953_t:CDS:1, partial [Gigaspora margarita]
ELLNKAIDIEFKKESEKGIENPKHVEDKKKLQILKREIDIKRQKII